jgi:uncharacterized membrane protein YeiH
MEDPISYFQIGNFLVIDLFAAGTNALNGALLAQNLGIVGPTAGRYLIDITSQQPAKQFVRGEWFVGTAVLTSVVYLICAHFLGLSIWPATLISFAIGFGFRVIATWRGWEKPMLRVPPDLVEGLPQREAYRQRRQENREENQCDPAPVCLATAP